MALKTDTKSKINTKPPKGLISIYVCTYKRNGPLKRLLESVAAAADHVAPICVSVVVVDDNPDGRAKQVVENFPDLFSGGIHYRHSGSCNISTARNLGIETAMQLGEWVAMTDDDQVVTTGWLAEMVAMQEATGANAVAGPVHLRYPEGSPKWLTEEPFHEILEGASEPDGAIIPVGCTGNSMLSSAFLKANPDTRFRTDLGKVGGEDIVFYRQAVAAGLKIRYAKEAIAHGEQPPERSTFRSIVRVCYWMGNTEYVTNFQAGDAGRLRLILRSGNYMRKAVARPFVRLAQGESAQWRFGCASVARSVGMLVGAVGVRVAHR